MSYPTDPVVVAGILISLVGTWGMFSFAIYKENPWFRFTMHTAVGATMAVMIITVLKVIENGVVVPFAKGDLSSIPVIILAIMLYTRFSKNHAWISRWPIAIVTGVGLGVAMRAHAETDMMTQVAALVTPLVTPSNVINGFNATFILVGAIATIAFFTFTFARARKGGWSKLATAGRFFIMFSLGAYFGNTVLSRFSLLLERIEFTLRALGILPW